MCTLTTDIGENIHRLEATRHPLCGKYSDAWQTAHLRNPRALETVEQQVKREGELCLIVASARLRNGAHHHHDAGIFLGVVSQHRVSLRRF